jgi:hypothetical protein
VCFACGKRLCLPAGAKTRSQLLWSVLRTVVWQGCAVLSAWAHLSIAVLLLLRLLLLPFLQNSLTVASRHTLGVFGHLVNTLDA